MMSLTMGKQGEKQTGSFRRPSIFRSHELVLRDLWNAKPKRRTTTPCCETILGMSPASVRFSTVIV